MKRKQFFFRFTLNEKISEKRFELTALYFNCDMDFVTENLPL